MLKELCLRYLRVSPTWTMRSYVDTAVEQIKQQVGTERVICALSGGVDSSVAAALTHRAVGDQLTASSSITGCCEPASEIR